MRTTHLLGLATTEMPKLAAAAESAAAGGEAVAAHRLFCCPEGAATSSRTQPGSGKTSHNPHHIANQTSHQESTYHPEYFLVPPVSTQKMIMQLLGFPHKLGFEENLYTLHTLLIMALGV